jgi:hypothetical protein
MSRASWAILVGLGVFLSACGDDDDSSPSASAGSGGAAGSDAGGSAGTGTQAAGTSGSAGSAAGGSGSALGTVGSGGVKCAGVTGASCASGQVCCERAPFGSNSCESSYAACADGLPVGCDEPGDCPAQKCCAKRPGVGTAAHQGTGCKASCAVDTDRIVCSSNDDCAGTGACMQSGDAALEICF